MDYVPASWPILRPQPPDTPTSGAMATKRRGVSSSFSLLPGMTDHAGPGRSGALAVHADGDLGVLQHLDELA